MQWLMLVINMIIQMVLVYAFYKIYTIAKKVRYKNFTIGKKWDSSDKPTN